MKSSFKKNFFIFLIISISILIFDQIVKSLIPKFLSNNVSIPIIPKLLFLSFIKNHGAGFGILQGQSTFLIFISIIIIGLILYYFENIQEKKYLLISFSLILGGALGNLLDRIFLGYVIDFIDFRFWPAFNIADSAITIGVLIILYYSIKEELNKKKK